MQWLVVVAGEFPHLFQPTIFDIIDPGGEVFDDVARHLFQLLPHPLAERHVANHVERIIHLSGEYVKDGAGYIRLLVIQDSGNNVTGNLHLPEFRGAGPGEIMR